MVSPERPPVVATCIGDTVWEQAVAALSAAEDAVLVCHVSPDGDALGSTLALARVLRASGCAVTVTWGDTRWRVPPSYRWLPGIDTAVAPSQAPLSPSLLVVLDTASVDRLGVLGPLASSAREVVVVDHHASNAQPIRGIQVVDPAAAATAVIVEELIRRLGRDIDVDTATCLYTGVVTDTGSFAHPVTTAAVHAVAGRLLEAGVRPDVVQRRLWGTRPFGAVQVLGAALSRARFEPDGAGGRGLVWTWTTAAEVMAAGIDVEEVETVMESLRAAAEADVAVVCKEDPDGSYRVSTRSRGGIDLGAACSVLGGGGHRLAAGFTSTQDVEDTMAALRRALAVVSADGALTGSRAAPRSDGSG